MQRLNHLLRFANAASGIVRVGGITAVGYVIVHRVVTPVIAVLVQRRLVDTSVVEDRQELDMRDTEFFQMADGCFFGQRQEFAFMLHAGIGRHREVAQVGLIHDDIRRIGHRRTLVFGPALGVGLLEVNNRSPLSVHTHCFGKDTRRLLSPLAVLEGTHGVEFSGEIAFHFGFPEVVVAFLKANNRTRFIGGLIIDAHFHLFGLVGPESELGFGTAVETLVLQFRLLGGASY